MAYPYFYILNMFQLRNATESDLPTINLVIEAAVMTWNLPERVKRLSLPSYYYNKIDLQHFVIIVAEQDDHIVAVAAWEQADSKNTPDQQSGLLLHGLYVHPNAQQQGIATQLLKAAENATRSQGLSGLLVKAQTDAVGYFIKRGMVAVEIQNHGRGFANRLWKPVSS